MKTPEDLRTLLMEPWNNLNGLYRTKRFENETERFRDGTKRFENETKHFGNATKRCSSMVQGLYIKFEEFLCNKSN